MLEITPEAWRTLTDDEQSTFLGYLDRVAGEPVAASDIMRVRARRRFGRWHVEIVHRRQHLIAVGVTRRHVVDAQRRSRRTMSSPPPIPDDVDERIAQARADDDEANEARHSGGPTDRLEGRR